MIELLSTSITSIFLSGFVFIVLLFDTNITASFNEGNKHFGNAFVRAFVSSQCIHLFLDVSFVSISLTSGSFGLELSSALLVSSLVVSMFS